MLVRMIRGLAGRARARERGAVAVEMVIVLTILIPLIGGIIAFGAIISQQITLDNTVREVARKAVVQGSGQTTYTQACNLLVSTYGSASPPFADNAPRGLITRTGESAVNCSSGSSDVICEDSDPGDTVTVEASVTASPVNFISVGLRSKAVYQCEFS